MIVNKLPAVGDMSGQPWEFRLSGVRALRSGRGIIQQLSGNWETIVTVAEQTASNYTVGQSYGYVITENGVFVKSGTFTVVSITLAGSNYDMVVSIADLDSSDFYTIYPATNNTTLLASISVSIKDTDTDVVNTFQFPVTTAGDCGFYLGKFINDLVKAKGLTIKNLNTTFARAGNYEITVNGVPLTYAIGYGGRFNNSSTGGLYRFFTAPTLTLFRRVNDTFIYSQGYLDVSKFLDLLFEFNDYPESTEMFNIINTCTSAGYKLRTLQIGADTYDVTHPIIRFLNPIGGVEEAWANGVNELVLSQGDAAYYQTILGSRQLVSRRDSYQSMILNLVPSKYLDSLTDIQAEINRLQAIRTSDYVELRLQSQSGNWRSFQVQVQPNSTQIATNNDNQNTATVTLEITFTDPL